MDVILIGANNPEIKRIITALTKKEKKLCFKGFVDNDPLKIGGSFMGYPIFCGTCDISSLDINNISFINLITRDTSTRYKTSKEVIERGGHFCNLIHPSVNLENVNLGVGNYIQENVVIQASVNIGNNSSIHMGALIGHESKIGNSVFVAHGCNISGFTNIEDGAFIGAGVTTTPRVSIGKWSVIGAGSVIIEDVPPYSVVVGNPGKIIKRNPLIHNSGDILN